MLKRVTLRPTGSSLTFALSFSVHTKDNILFKCGVQVELHCTYFNTLSSLFYF